MRKWYWNPPNHLVQLSLLHLIEQFTQWWTSNSLDSDLEPTFTPMTSKSQESRGLISENYSFHDIYLKVERGDEWSLEKSSLQEFLGHHVTIHFLKICRNNYLKKGRRLKQNWKYEDRMFSKDIISWSLVIFVHLEVRVHPKKQNQYDYWYTLRKLSQYIY